MYYSETCVMNPNEQMSLCDGNSPSTVPQVEDQVAQKPYMRVLNIN